MLVLGIEPANATGDEDDDEDHSTICLEDTTMGKFVDVGIVAVAVAVDGSYMRCSNVVVAVVGGRQSLN